jgi:hypothetical protein
VTKGEREKEREREKEVLEKEREREREKERERETLSGKMLPSTRGPGCEQISPPPPPQPSPTFICVLLDLPLDLPMVFQDFRRGSTLFSQFAGPQMGSLSWLVDSAAIATAVV